MKAMVWFIALAAVSGVVYGLYRVRAKWEERNKASEERFASFMAQTLPKVAAGAAVAAPVVPAKSAAPKAADDTVVPQRLLFEAASKAGDAGEPALAIQLYAKLLARYPQTALAEQARAAVAAQKKKLVPKP
ncbi:MAG TPA: hypothetical protein VM140_04380 [Burkholderiales bacterium]|nr:hypothetical protein [Burkholderiales bacterium]